MQERRAGARPSPAQRAETGASPGKEGPGPSGNRVLGLTLRLHLGASLLGLWKAELQAGKRGQEFPSKCCSRPIPAQGGFAAPPRLDAAFQPQCPHFGAPASARKEGGQLP